MNEEKRGINVERKVRVKDADGDDAYELKADADGISIRTVKVRWRAGSAFAEAVRTTNLALAQFNVAWERAFYESAPPKFRDLAHRRLLHAERHLAKAKLIRPTTRSRMPS